MKTKSLFIPVALLVLSGLTFCERPEPYVVSLASPGKYLANRAGDSIPDLINGSATGTGNNSADYFNPDSTYGSVTDIEGNIYRTIQIGAQTWMAQNLMTTHYNDGDKIPDVSWPGTSGPNSNIYGAYYTHYVVNTGKLCPAGWHVPDDEEWKQLEMELGMSRASADTSYGDFDVYGMGERGTDQGAKMKSATGWNAWEGKLCIGNNSSGFSALPAGDSEWRSIGYCTTFWCSGGAWGRSLSCADSKVGRAIYYEHYGLSVRCIKD